MKFLFSMCNCMIDSDVGMDDFSLLLGILHMCGHMHVQLHVLMGMDFIYGSSLAGTIRHQIFIQYSDAFFNVL